MQTIRYYRIPVVGGYNGYHYHQEISTWVSTKSTDPRAVAIGEGYYVLVGVANPSFVHTPGTLIVDPSLETTKPSVEYVTQIDYDTWVADATAYFNSITNPDPE